MKRPLISVPLLAVPLLALALLPSAALVACKNNKPDAEGTAPSASVTTTAAKPKLDRLSRADFNRVAAEMALPLFWIDEKDGDGGIDPKELAVYWGLDRKAKLADYVKDGAFTPAFTAAYEKMVEASKAKEPDPRKAAVKKELSQGRVTLVATDLAAASPEEKKFVAAVFRAADSIEALYAKQEGTGELAAKIPTDDAASRTLFYRGQGPKCQAPATENDPTCGALAEMPKAKLSGLYPAEMLAKPNFCDDILTKDKSLTDPFTVVASGPKAKPYHEAWPAETAAITKELEGAAKELGSKEPALRDYLLAAAKSFSDDNWWPADEAWAKMDAKNSRFYLRIAPDEVYNEPCSTKALFHVSFGLINQGSLKWQSKLDPLKAEMEKALADFAGPPYAARDVQFKIPDFVDIALNAGDSRTAFGATIGQSLPNFGPVANGGRGRTVAMTNFYTDADSIAASKEQADSLFCADTMAKWTSEQEPQLMSTVLHEAAHNLGPAHQYKANGKIDREAFGGPLASTLEELKAQTSALFFTDWLVDKKQITRDEADKAHVRDMFWAFGHISRGMYEADKHPKNYSQLAAIQVGALMKDGAMTWKADETATNKKDKGCFSVDFAKMPASIKTLMGTVAKIKAKGDKPGAEALLEDYVDVTGDRRKVHDVITERITRAPKASFVYTVKVD